MIRRLFARFAEAYRKRRWLRWGIDTFTVLIFFLSIALVHGGASWRRVISVITMMSDFR